MSGMDVLNVNVSGFVSQSTLAQDLFKKCGLKDKNNDGHIYWEDVSKEEAVLFAEINAKVLSAMQYQTVSQGNALYWGGSLPDMDSVETKMSKTINNNANIYSTWYSFKVETKNGSKYLIWIGDSRGVDSTGESRKFGGASAVFDLTAGTKKFIKISENTPYYVKWYDDTKVSNWCGIMLNMCNEAILYQDDPQKKANLILISEYLTSVTKQIQVLNK